MTGAEHYLEAERLLQAARDYQPGSKADPPLVCREEALVHATLALAAAIGLGMAATDPADEDVTAWYEAAGTRAARLKNGGASHAATLNDNGTTFREIAQLIDGTDPAPPELPGQQALTGGAS